MSSVTRGFPLLTEGKVHSWSASVAAGVDTVGLSFPIRPDFDPSGWDAQIRQLGTPDEHSSFRRSLPSGGFVNTGVGGSAWVEASLPKRAGDDNVHALGLPDALETAREMVREAAEFVEVDRARCKGFEDCKVVRLDLVRDFDAVQHLPRLLDGLAAVPQAGRVKARRWSDAERNMAQSLRVGPKAWGASLYDKHAETAGKAEPGRLRSEFRLHSGQLRSRFSIENGGAVRVVADLEEQKLRALTRAWFDRVGFGHEVGTVASLYGAVFVAENGLTKRTRQALWTYLTAGFYGGCGMGRNAASRYRRLASSLGLAPVDVLQPVEGVVVRLDFDRGTEVRRVA